MSCSASEIHAWKAILKNLSDIISIFLHTYITFWCPCRMRKTWRSFLGVRCEPPCRVPILQLGWRVWEQSREKQWGSGRQQTGCKSWKGALLDIELIFFFNQYPLNGWVSYLCIHISKRCSFLLTLNIVATYMLLQAKGSFCGLWSIFSLQAIKITACDLYKYKP